MKAKTITLALAAASSVAMAGETPAMERPSVTAPVWVARPRMDDLRRLYPKGVKGVTANVAVDCIVGEQGTLDDCKVAQEEPAGLGFGESTLQLAKLFRLRPIDGAGVPVAGRRQVVPVRWYAALGPR